MSCFQGHTSQSLLSSISTSLKNGQLINIVQKSHVELMGVGADGSCAIIQALSYMIVTEGNYHYCTTIQVDAQIGLVVLMVVGRHESSIGPLHVLVIDLQSFLNMGKPRIPPKK